MPDENQVINIARVIEEAILDTCNEHLHQLIRDLYDIDDICNGLLSINIYKHFDGDNICDHATVSFAIKKGLTRINTLDDGASVDIIPFEMVVKVSDIHNNPHIIGDIQSVLVRFISGLQNSYEYKFIREVSEIFEASGWISSSSVIIRGYKNNPIRNLSVFADINLNSGMIRIGMTQPYRVAVTTFMICQTDSILEKLESLVDGYINSPILRLIEYGSIDYCEQHSKIRADTIDRVRMDLSNNTNDTYTDKPHVSMSPNVLLISSLIDDEYSIIDTLYAMKDKIDRLISEVSYTK